MTTVMTVGHSTHPIEHFLEILTRNGVSAVADVRSSPFSRHQTQFNREPLKGALKSAGISYVFLGGELGARSDDPRHYKDGRVVYGRLAGSTPFQAGLGRVLAGAEKHRIALMCAERDPITCHRTILVSRALVERGVQVEHITADGSVEPHEHALLRLMEELNINPNDFFATPEELRDRAYHEQEERIAYTRSESVAAE